MSITSSPSTPHIGSSALRDLQGRFSRVVRPDSLLLVTGGTSTGKSSAFADLRNIAHTTKEEIDALYLADAAWAEHQRHPQGISASHIHPEGFDGVEHVFDAAGTLIGHKHHSEVPGVAHFPFEVSNSLYQAPSSINPLIQDTYTRLFTVLAHTTIPAGVYCPVELAGGKNRLSTYQPEHHMASLDTSYKCITEILTETLEEQRITIEEFRAKVGAIIDICAPRALRIEWALGRKAIGEERTPVLIDVQGESDAEETLATVLQVPFIRIQNDKTLSSAQRSQGFYEQLDEQLRAIR